MKQNTTKLLKNTAFRKKILFAEKPDLETLFNNSEDIEINYSHRAQ